jgi:hypothetical protein
MREDPADNISKMISTTWLIRMTMRRPFFAASILQKRMELNEITKERNHQIHIDGWGDLLNSILLHEKEYEEGLKLTTLDQITTSTVTVTVTVTESNKGSKSEKKTMRGIVLCQHSHVLEIGEEVLAG